MKAHTQYIVFVMTLSNPLAVLYAEEIAHHSQSDTQTHFYLSVTHTLPPPSLTPSHPPPSHTELERNALKSEFDSLMQTNSWRSVFPRLELFDLPIMPRRCTEGRGSHDPDETSHDMEDVSHDPEDMSRDLHENVQTERHQQACSGQGIYIHQY